jgi:hypothetical protein
LLGLLLCLALGCQEAPREEDESVAAPAAEAASARPGVGAAPAPQAASAPPPKEAALGEVPWLPNGELIEVQQFADAGDPEADGSRTVFEVALTPEEALAAYRTALERAGWNVQKLGERAIIGYTATRMVTAVFKPGSGATRVEVYVNANPG